MKTRRLKKISLVGYGYWGPNLLRNFYETPGCEVKYCCDKDAARLEEVKKRYPTVITTTNFGDLLSDKKLDAIVIAVPTKFHFPLAKAALKAGKDILVEKPLAPTYKEAHALALLAEKEKKILMVDHTFIYNEAVRKTKEIIDKGEIGDILYIDSIRANLGLFQKDVNVVFDLASHDFSIIQYFLGTTPKSIRAFGKSHFNKQEDVCYLFTEYPKNIFAHVHVSWLSPLKVRRMLIVGTKKMIVYDDVEMAEKIKIFDKGVSIEKGLTKKLEEMKISYRSGDAWLPNVKGTEALSLMAKAFIEAINTREKPETNGRFAASIVDMLEKGTQSARVDKTIKI